MIARRCLAICLAFALLGGTSTRINLDVHNAQLTDVVTLLSAQSGVNVITDDSVKPQLVTLHLHGVTFDEALSAIVQAHGLQVRRAGNALIVGSSDAMNRRYDDGNGTLGARTAVLTLQHASPADVAKELTEALPSGTVIVADARTASVILSSDRETIARARSLVAALDSEPSLGMPERTHAYALRYQRATDVVKLLKGLVPDGSAIADGGANAVIVTGPQEMQASVASFVAKLDVATPQVAFEVKVADVEPVNESSNVGLEFGGLDLQGQPQLGSATYSFSRGTIAVNARLNALVTQGRAQILATPRLVTLNDHEASLLIGETYPIIYQTSAFGGQEVQFVDIGVKLKLTPTIGRDGSVTADLHPEYSEIVGFTGTNLPIIANRKIDSTLRAASDQTIVLGGLLRDVSAETVEKIPGLSSIPVLGKFFQNRLTSHQRNEIVFLITPHVIMPGDRLPDR